MNASLLDSLNPQQKKAVLHNTGPALVIAGAGSGKTRVITHRVAHLIEQGVAPNQIMMMTFTNKAAQEMRTRIHALVGKNDALESPIQGLWCGTFHSMANRFLRQHATKIGYLPTFTILDESDAHGLIKTVVENIVQKPISSGGQRFPSSKNIKNIISSAFNRNLSISDVIDADYFFLADFCEELEAVGAAYAIKKRENNCMDFDDLLSKWLQLLQIESLAQQTAKHIRYVLVDEFQDVNHVQCSLLDLLTATHRNLMVVGDDAQSIYGWRGADFSFLLDFPERFGSQIYKLEANYRSSPQILLMANHSIDHNYQQFKKVLHTNKPDAIQPNFVQTYNTEQEADYVLQRLLHYQNQHIPLSQMGVLYRNHAQSNTLQIRLTEMGVPFVLRSGIKFFEQAHIKDALCFLRVLANPLDQLAWSRLLKMLPGIGPRGAERIYQLFVTQQAVRLTSDNAALLKAIPQKARGAWSSFAECFVNMQAQESPSAMLNCLQQGFYLHVLESKYDHFESRLADLEYLIEFAMRYTKLEDLLAHLLLMGESQLRHEDDVANNEDAVTLSSIHNAKGLEWDVVVVIGLVDGKFPNNRHTDSVEKLEEERRVFYVAITRCRQHLELISPFLVVDRGQYTPALPSRFVSELPEEVLVKTATQEAAALVKQFGTLSDHQYSMP